MRRNSFGLSPADLHRGLALVLLLTLAAHCVGLWGDFVIWDDTTHVTQNPVIRGLTWDHLRQMFTTMPAKLYVPLTWLSLAVDHALWGRNPFGYHLTNLLLHLANTALVVLLTERLLRTTRPSAAVTAALLTGAFFGVHPLRVESVAWVTERKDVLFAFFYLLALSAYWLWLQRAQRRYFWICFGCFTAAVLSKAAAVTLPLVLLLLDALAGRRPTLRDKTPLFAIAMLVSAITIFAQSRGAGATLVGLDAIPLWARAGLLGYSALFYVRLTFWPSGLTVLHPSFDEMGWTPVAAAVWLAAGVGVTALLFALRKRLPVLWVGWVFYLITLAPTNGLLPAGIHVVAERFSYLPSLGLTVPIALGIARVGEQLHQQPVGRSLLAASVCGVLVVLTVQTAKRSRAWQDTETLFQSALAVNPNCLPAHLNLALWYTAHGQHAAAIHHGERALAIAPQSLRGHKILARAYQQAGQPAAALPLLQRAVASQPQAATLWDALAECWSALGDEVQAAAARRQAEQLRSETPAD